MEDKEGKGARQPPVQQGERLEVEIIGIGKDGDGVAKFEGFVIIIPGTKKGERHEVEISKVMQRVAFAEIIKPQEE